MMHVSAWLSPDHAVHDNEKTKRKKGKGIDDNPSGIDNKPMICLQLIPGLAKRWHNMGEEELMEKALGLESIVIEHFKEFRSDFIQPVIKPYLVSRPHPCQ
jgi:hypothetical protein